VEIKGKVYGHIVDPRMGHPVANGVRSVTVLSPSCTEAGQLATALFILGPEQGMALLERFANAEACIITGTARFMSKGFMNYAEAHD
jgi:thiamine biosynthesis lipoprotein